MAIFPRGKPRPSERGGAQALSNLWVLSMPTPFDAVKFGKRGRSMFFVSYALYPGGGQGCSVDRNLELHTSLLHYCTYGLGAANDAQNVRADTARGKDNDQQNLSEMIM